MNLRYVSLVTATALLAACGGGGGSGSDPIVRNLPPGISSISPKATVANGTSPAIEFTVSDEDVDGVSISASSDRPGLVPDDGLAISGTGRARTLVVSPAVDTTGDAVITIIVRDREGLAASSSFLLTVEAEQRSIQRFAREAFVRPADDDPALINAVEFAQDADEDDFDDLLSQ